MKALLIAASLACALPVSARLGETLPELTNRYGSPTRTNDLGWAKELHFLKDKDTITVTLIDGRSAREVLAAFNKFGDPREVRNRMSGRGAVHWTEKKGFSYGSIEFSTPGVSGMFTESSMQVTSKLYFDRKAAGETAAAKKKGAKF